MRFTNQLLMLASFATVFGHMEVTSPAPRRSQHLAGNKEPVDYDMSSPLGDKFSFPCRGYGPGPSSGSFKAGNSIPVTIGGGAMHNGGHCQFSITYDNKNFAVLKTVMGNCLTGGLNYQVPLPQDAPNGKATLAWTWINRTGNREYYMNCMDIEINGGSNNGKITGPQMLVANLPGYTTFPEGFKDDYGKDLFDKQPMITVSPSGSNIDPNPKPDPKPSTQTQTQTQTQISTQTKPVVTSTATQIEPKPEPTGNPQKPNPSTCEDGKMYCLNGSTIAMCFNKAFWSNPCADGTTCKGAAGNAQCY